MENLSNNQFKNVYDLSASRKVKQATGQSAAIRMSAPSSPEMIKHEDEAMAMGNPVKKKQSLSDKVYGKVGKFLGIDYEG